jgi:hypothetical protein
VIRTDGELVPTDDHKRQLNETVAYKLKQAMLKNDRKTFASMLQYPFHSENTKQNVSTWNGNPPAFNARQKWS